MRHIDRLPKPAILRDKQAEWQEKYDIKLAADPHARPDNSKYAHKEIKNQGDRNFYTQDIPSHLLKQIA